MNAAYLAVRILAGGSAAIASPLLLTIAVLGTSDPTAGTLGGVVGLLVFCGVALVLARVIVDSLRPGPPTWLVVAAAAVLPLVALTWLFK